MFNTNSGKVESLLTFWDVCDKIIKSFIDFHGFHFLFISSLAFDSFKSFCVVSLSIFDLTQTTFNLIFESSSIFHLCVNVCVTKIYNLPSVK